MTPLGTFFPVFDIFPILADNNRPLHCYCSPITNTFLLRICWLMVRVCHDLCLGVSGACQGRGCFRRSFLISFRPWRIERRRRHRRCVLALFGDRSEGYAVWYYRLLPIRRCWSIYGQQTCVRKFVWDRGCQIVGRLLGSGQISDACLQR